jgi:hypothetical protein
MQEPGKPTATLGKTLQDRPHEAYIWNGTSEHGKVEP